MKFSKMLIILGIGCVVGLLLVFGVRLQAQYSPKKESIAMNVDELKAMASSRMGQFRNRQQGSNWGGMRNSNMSSQTNSKESNSKEDTDYYRVIVDNSLFRPLGWRPPNKEPEYVYIGTAYEETGVIEKAFLREQRSGRFFNAYVGDKVGDAVVKEIKQDQIILDKDGEEITLREGKMQLLNSSGSNRSAPSRSESNDDNNNSADDAVRRAKEAAKKNEQMKKAMMERAEEMKKRFENMSRQQRDRMRREFSGRRRGR